MTSLRDAIYLVSRRLNSFLQKPDGGIRQRRSAQGLDEQLYANLDANHREDVVCRDGADEGDANKQRGVDDVAEHRRADGAHPKQPFARLFLDFHHRPSVDEFSA